MSDIAYIQWGLIHLEEDVTTSKPTTMHPPMLSNLALDMGASIFFQFKTNPGDMRVGIATTAVSAPITNPPFALFTGDQTDILQEVKATWHSQYDGPSALFSSEINMLGSFFKIHNEHPKSVVVTNVAFNQVSTS